MYQLHPFLATVIRPVYWDRRGNVFLQVDCPECSGEGSLHVSSINPSERERDISCHCCGGFGQVMEPTDEVELTAEFN